MLRWMLPTWVAGSVVACMQQPAPQLQAPQVVATSQVPDSTSVELTAEFNHIRNITDAGFRLWAAEGTVLSKVSEPVGSTIFARFDGLEPDTEYSYLVYFGNGLTENCSDAKTFRTLQSPEVAPVDPGDDPGDDPIDDPGDDLGDDPIDDPGDDPGDDPVDDPVVDPVDDPVDNTKFDPTLLAYLLENYDTDGDGVMSRMELENISELVISGLVLDSLDGLETLTELRSLGTGDNILACIDVTANKKLEFLAAGNDRYLEEIILDNPVLSSTYFIVAPNLRHLDVSRLPQLGNCQWYNLGLEEIDFSHNCDLDVLIVQGTNIKELDLSNNRKLRILDCKSNPDLKVVWLWSGIKLDSIEYDEHTEIRYK